MRGELCHFYVKRDGRFDVIRPGTFKNRGDDAYFPVYICTTESEEIARDICEIMDNN